MGIRGLEYVHGPRDARADADANARARRARVRVRDTVTRARAIDRASVHGAWFFEAFRFDPSRA